ncbi:Acylphosphatase [Burkholderiales bacterium]|nr:Acylphosphatase [Burkholderiales bacterium]
MSEPKDAPARDAGDVLVTVHGRVQGVGFRESMIAAAMALGVSGWVRNRIEGSVEAVLRGTPQARQALLRWSQRGPAAARVERVEVRPASAQESELVRDGFRRLETR